MVILMTIITITMMGIITLTTIIISSEAMAKGMKGMKEGPAKCMKGTKVLGGMEGTKVLGGMEVLKDMEGKKATDAKTITIGTCFLMKNIC
jgi:hypothetical protein